MVTRYYYPNLRHVKAALTEWYKKIKEKPLKKTLVNESTSNRSIQSRSIYFKMLIYSNKYHCIHKKHKNEIISNVFDSTVAHNDLRILSPLYNYKWRQPQVYKYHICDIKVTWAARGWQGGWKEKLINLHHCKYLHWFKREEDGGNNVDIVLLNCEHLLPSHFAIDHSINKRICWKF